MLRLGVAEWIMPKKTLTFAIMDPPYENARTATALRLIDIAIRRGHDVNVFAHGRDVAQEDHPLPKDWITALIAEAKKHGAKLDWINCGLCVDERGVGEAIEGVRRGSPADFWKFAASSDNTLVIGTK
jgi:tRNA 2-thiouridine synthesizing protein D